MSDERLVSPELKDLALDALVRQLFELSWGKARSWIETGKITVNGVVVTEGRTYPGAGARICLRMNAPRAGAGGASARVPSFELTREQVIHSDTQIIVVNKPSGINSVPYERGERGTLQDAVCKYLKQSLVDVVHRIDKETSGLIVFARTQVAAKSLSNQFRFHTVHRRYVALAYGHVNSGTLRSTLIENRGDGLRGSVAFGKRVAAGQGQEAITHFKALKHFASATLLECRLETGRTHQIRIHLSESGHPLLGEKLYIRNYTGELLEAPRVMLHAEELGFVHPTGGDEVRWRKDAPEDFQRVLEGLEHPLE